MNFAAFGFEILPAEDRSIRGRRALFRHSYLIIILPINFRISLPENLREGLPFGSEPL